MEGTDRYGAGARPRAGGASRRVFGLAAATMALCVALGVLAGQVLAAKGDTSLISRRSASAGGQGANGDSLSPSLSRTGRYVAFDTVADNLGGPAKNVSNVYVYERGARKVELVSRRSAAGGGKGANGDSSNGFVSDSGRFVVFTTEATNLGGPAKSVFNLYVYDRKERKVELVSRRSASAGGQGANGDSFGQISAGGRFVVFQTDATNLGGPATAAVNVYVYDRQTDSVELVSRRSASAGGQGGNNDSDDPAISADGRFVAFETDATNLGPAKNVTNVYVYDRMKDRVKLVSRRSASAGGQGGDDDSSNPTISSSGRFVAFRTLADNLGGPIQDVLNVYVYDRTSKRVTLVSRRSSSAGGQGGDENSGPGGVISLSGNGRFVAFDTDADNLGGPVQGGTNVYVYDRKNKRIVLASRRSLSAGGGGANPPANGRDPSLSADGRFVAFWTEADNLGGPTNANRNVYIHQQLFGP